MTDLRLDTQGDRYEVTGIADLDEALAALKMLSAAGVPPDAPFHCYLNGTKLAVWTTWSGPRRTDGEGS